uniref:Uncharacterized protein n=1 Tax=Boodleopsis sp. FL1161 TaxID=2364084 RepID=A0A386AZ87_9CHLO|nr:hypothetical protein [Boodleopsis sp. FL1161]
MRSINRTFRYYSPSSSTNFVSPFFQNSLTQPFLLESEQSAQIRHNPIEARLESLQEQQSIDRFLEEIDGFVEYVVDSLTNPPVTNPPITSHSLTSPSTSVGSSQTSVVSPPPSSVAIYNDLSVLQRNPIYLTGVEGYFQKIH